MSSGTNKRIHYDDIREEAEKPSSDRKRLPGKDGRLRNLRKYSRTSAQLKVYWSLSETLGAFLNPLERDGPCKGQVEALIQLGINVWHSFAAVKKELPVIMGLMPSAVHANQWVAFSSKKSRNPDRGKDIDGRIIQNFEVLQRLTGKDPYGYKLRQVHACIDIKFVPVGQDPIKFNDGQVKGIPGTYYFRLNTQFSSFKDVKPYNNYKGKRRGRPKKQPPEDSPASKSGD